MTWLKSHGRLRPLLIDDPLPRVYFRREEVTELLQERERWISQAQAEQITGLSNYSIRRAVAAGDVLTRAGQKASIERLSLLAWAEKERQRRDDTRASKLEHEEAVRIRNSPPDEDHVWLCAGTVAAMLGMTPRKLRALSNDNHIPHTRVGRRIWYRRDHVEQIGAAAVIISRHEYRPPSAVR